MKPDYGDLAGQYGSFLIAIGGVSITVLTLVLSAWGIQRQSRTTNDGVTKSAGEEEPASNRPALVISLIIATFNSFAGAQLMAETVAIGNAGPTQFLWASVNIFIGVSVVIFAVLLLTTEYRKESNAPGVRIMSRGVFRSVLIGVISWTGYSVIWRMPAHHPWLATLVPLALVLILVGVFKYLVRANGRKLSEVLLPVTFVSITSFTVFSLLAFPLSLELRSGSFFEDFTVGFFVFAITSTCLCLWISARCCVGKETDECCLWPPQGWLCWFLKRSVPTTRDERPVGLKIVPHNTTSPGEEVVPSGTVDMRSKVRKAANMSQRIPKILILSSDTGGGHRSAAAAIVAGVQKFFDGQSYAVRVVKAVEESHSITAKMVGIYNWLLRNKQHWMKYVYWAMNRFRPETREFFHKRCVDYVTELFERWCPHIVVSVHPLTQHIIARVLKELKLADRIPLVSVVTDPYYGFWKGWACDDVTLYLVASDDARRQLVDYGIAPERIKISGMPVHHKFAYPGEEAAQAARRALGLDPEKFTVFVNAGWEGGGNIPQIFRELVRGQLEVQAIFLAGRNEELRADAESLAESASFPIKVIGYSEHVEQLMGAANVMISKLGGLTTFEAFACRLPIIADGITAPMPQEAGAASLLVKRGAGVLLQRAGDIVPVIRRMVEDTAHYSAMRAATIGLAIPNATRHIVEEITALIPASTDAPEPAVLAEVVTA